MHHDAHSLSDVEFVAFDTETTGLDPIGGRLVELGAVRFNLRGEIDRWSRLVDPRMPIPFAVRRIHGIDDAMVAGQPTERTLVPRLIEFFGDPNTILLAHNASFDLGFLRAALRRAALPFPAHAVIDSVRLARRRVRLPSYRLEALGRHYGLIDKEDHRALPDALLLHRVFLKLLIEAESVQTVGDLFQLAPPQSFAGSDAGRRPTPPRFRAAWPIADTPLFDASSGADAWREPATLDHLQRVVALRLPLVLVYSGGSK
ncbi:MAG: 3'-5' exonuclease, partial [Planctomycetia bacterium]